MNHQLLTDKQPLAVYIHWPFCTSKCPYCDFNSHVRESVDHGAWKDALLKELSYYQFLAPTHRVVSIFFGGGTPSLMDVGTAGALIEQVRKQFSTKPDIEITLEANPTSVEAGKLKAFRDAGVNRVSLGVQSLRDEELKFLGRKHSGREALKAVETAAALFERMSFDLIYARPGQSVASWEKELKEALPYTKGHMSLYQLTIEENTPFHLHHEQKRFTLPPDDSAADMYETTQEIMEAHGLPMYEVSNHAAPGQESRHNLAYWRGEDYIGIGPGAHGRIRDSRFANHESRFAATTLKLPEKWLAQVREKGNGIDKMEAIDAKETATEKLLMGLRLREGVALAHMDAGKLKPYLQQGLIEQRDNRIAATPRGMLVLNRLTADIAGFVTHPVA